MEQGKCLCQGMPAEAGLRVLTAGLLSLHRGRWWLLSCVSNFVYCKAANASAPICQKPLLAKTPTLPETELSQSCQPSAEKQATLTSHALLFQSARDIASSAPADALSLSTWHPKAKSMWDCGGWGGGAHLYWQMKLTSS